MVINPKSVLATKITAPVGHTGGLFVAYRLYIVYRVWCLGLRVWDLSVGVWCLVFGVWGREFTV